MKSKPRLIDVSLLEIWWGDFVTGKIQVTRDLASSSALTPAGRIPGKRNHDYFEVIDTSKKKLYTFAQFKTGPTLVFEILDP